MRCASTFCVLLVLGAAAGCCGSRAPLEPAPMAQGLLGHEENSVMTSEIRQRFIEGPETAFEAREAYVRDLVKRYGGTISTRAPREEAAVHMLLAPTA